jgi:uncharacterized protein YeaO (DUF488 family)
MSSKVPARNIRSKRAYEAPSSADGVRVLVDRLWPRRVSRQNAALDRWVKEIAPSAGFDGGLTFPTAGKNSEDVRGGIESA